MIKQECINIYRQAFGYDKDFEDILFSNCFKYCRYLTENEKIVSIVFLLPCEISVNGEMVSATYIFAAATLPEFRGKGYMSKLIEEIKNKSDIVFLRPAENSLIDYYSRFGFLKIDAKSHKDKNNFVYPIKEFKKMAEKLEIDETKEKFDVMYFSKKGIDIKNLNFLYSME